MQSKLTLTVEKDIVMLAKAYAKEKGQSLSDIIQNYLKALTAPIGDPIPVSLQVKKLQGAIRLPEKLDPKQAYTDYLSRKHR